MSIPVYQNSLTPHNNKTAQHQNNACKTQYMLVTFWLQLNNLYILKEDRKQKPDLARLSHDLTTVMGYTTCFILWNPFVDKSFPTKLLFTFCTWWIYISKNVDLWNFFLLWMIFFFIMLKQETYCNHWKITNLRSVLHFLCYLKKNQ